MHRDVGICIVWHQQLRDCLVIPALDAGCIVSLQLLEALTFIYRVLAKKKRGK